MCFILTFLLPDTSLSPRGKQQTTWKVTLQAFILTSFRQEKRLFPDLATSISIADVDINAPEVGIEGWLDLEAAYAFTYLDTTGTPLSTPRGYPSTLNPASWKHLQSYTSTSMSHTSMFLKHKVDISSIQCCCDPQKLVLGACHFSNLGACRAEEGCSRCESCAYGRTDGGASASERLLWRTCNN